MPTRHALSVVLSVLIALLAPKAAFAQDFDAEYKKLIAQFEESVADSAAAAKLVDRADDLYDRIRQHRRDNRKSLSDAQRDQLKDLSVEVRDFKAVTRVVAQVHNAADASIEGFETVNTKLGLEPKVIQTHDSGLELVRIEVGKFVSLLLRNPTKTTFAIMYEVNDPDRPGGVGTAACESYSVLSGLFNSRDRKLEGLELKLRPRATGAGGCD